MHWRAKARLVRHYEGCWREHMQCLRRQPVETRLWGRVVAGPGGCQIWTGAGKDKSGHGGVFHEGRSRGTHQVAFELTYGRVPDGLQVNHRCGVGSCVNPLHLYAGTQQQNMDDRFGARTACKNGHPLTPANRRVTRSGRNECIPCVAAMLQRRKDERAHRRAA